MFSKKHTIPLQYSIVIILFITGMSQDIYTTDNNQSIKHAKSSHFHIETDEDNDCWQEIKLSISDFFKKSQALPCGFISFLFDTKKTGYIHEVCIEENFKQHGLGSLLVTAAFIYFIHHNVSEITWTALGKDPALAAKTKLILFYKKLGGIEDEIANTMKKPRLGCYMMLNQQLIEEYRKSLIDESQQKNPIQTAHAFLNNNLNLKGNHYTLWQIIYTNKLKHTCMSRAFADCQIITNDRNENL